MSYADILPALVRRKLKSDRSSVFARLPHTELIDPELPYRHVGLFGQTGRGKTTTLIATGECQMRLGFKVIAFDQQNELGFLSLPCPKEHPIYPKLSSQGRKPRGLRTRVLLPLAYDGGQRVVRYDRIPAHWEFFLLDLFDVEVTSQDWNVLMGGLSGVREQILKTALLRKQPEWGVLDVYLHSQKRFLKGDFGYPDVNEDAKDAEPVPTMKNVFPKQSITTLNRGLMGLNSARFLAPHIWRGHRTPYLLDWEKEVLDKHTVTIIKTSLLPPKLRHALCTYLIRKTFMLAQKRFLGKRTVPPISFIVPEATDFFPKNIPEEYKETLPPLRETFYTVFRRGRRHRVVISYDTAYYGTIDPRIINNTHYIFLFDNNKEILNEIVNSFNPINRENIKGMYDLLKDKGRLIYLRRDWPRAMYLRDCVPACMIPMEGQNFIEVWRKSGGKLKPVDPYYKIVNRIHEDMKRRVRKAFQQLQEQMKMAEELPVSGPILKLVQYLQSLAEQGKNKVQLSTIVNTYKMNKKDSPSDVTLYNWLKKLHELGLVTVYKEKRPFTVTIHLKKLTEILRRMSDEKTEKT